MMEKKLVAVSYFPVLCAVLVMVIMGCASTKPETEKTSAGYIADTGLLEVRNETSVPMALFAGHVERGIFLGVISSFGVQRFDIAKIPDIPRKGAFILRTASEEAYRQKAGHLSEEDVVYTALVVYDLDAPENKAQVSIPKKIDSTQKYSVYVSNNSPYILELRLDNPTGEKIAALPPFQQNMMLWLSPDERGLPYQFFPVYVHVDSRTTEIKSFVIDPNIRGSRVEPTSGGDYVQMLNFDAPRSSGMEDSCIVLFGE
ncbi:hypothetical protein AGMMS49940_16580 [Spirochaetia bacterium]|nr:hypothetical protein AGMMS49940_16580 [Spirochaetia bacterium]